MTREPADADASPPERLNLDVELSGAEGRPIQVRLSVWPDGALWFRVCQPTKNGWAFMFALRGQLPGPSGVKLVGWFERSLQHCVSGARPKTDLLLFVWAPVAPVVEHAA